MKMIKQYFYNMIVFYSQGFNTLRGGHPDESISQWTGRKYLEYKEISGVKKYWFSIQKTMIDLLFWNKLWKLEKNHCINSLNGEKDTFDIWEM